MAKAKVTKSDRTLAILAHVLGLFTSFIGALIILLVAEDSFSKANAKEALNWQLSMIIYTIISIILMFVLIGFLLIGLLALANLVFCILAAVKASENENWKYPLTIRFIK